MYSIPIIFKDVLLALHDQLSQNSACSKNSNSRILQMPRYLGVQRAYLV